MPPDTPRSGGLQGLHTAYVVQGYPKASHVFIQREVLALRAGGALVDAYSVRRPEAQDVLSEQDRAEATTTTSLRPLSIGALARAHLETLTRWPRAYLGLLAVALRAAPRGARGRLWQVFYFVQAVVLHDRLRRRGARHVHAHLANVAADLTWLAVELGNRAGTGPWTWSFTMHGPTEFRDVNRFNLARKVAAADLVVCISDFCRSQLMALSDPAEWPKLAVVHCGVDLERFAPIDRTGREPRRLLSVGRLVPEKAQSVLLHAVGELVQRGFEVHATLVGDGPDLPRLLELRHRLDLDERVELPGALGQDELVAHYQAADLFVLGSFDEGVPVVLMEAMASGLPVVATRITGIPELIEDGESGVLVSPGRADLLVDAVAQLLEDSELRSSLGKRARLVVEERFDAAAEAARLGGLFRDGLRGNGTS